MSKIDAVVKNIENVSQKNYLNVLMVINWKTIYLYRGTVGC